MYVMYTVVRVHYVHTGIACTLKCIAVKFLFASHTRNVRLDEVRRDKGGKLHNVSPFCPAVRSPYACVRMRNNV